MEITSPNSLWKDYDVTALPLNASELSKKTVDGVLVREFYFDGFTTVDGKARAFIRIRENAKAKAVIMFLTDKSGLRNGPVAQAMFERGYTVAELDYVGVSDAEPRFTIYPTSLSECNGHGSFKFNAPVDALNSRWFVWTCVARRATYLLHELFPQSKIFALGKELGGNTVYKLAAFNDGLTACATLLNIIPEVIGSGNPMINYRAALDNNAYAPISKVPLFMSVCTNDTDGSLDKMSELAQSTASLKCFRIVERAFADGIKVVYDQIDTFFSSYIDGTPKYPHITVKPANSENNLYFNINIKDAEDIDFMSAKVGIYVAFGINNPTHRNWTSIKALNLGDSEYIANVAVLQNDRPVYAFVNLTANDTTVSSPVISVLPKTLNIQAQPRVRRRLIYDGSMGKDVWLAPGGEEVKVKSGPFGIEGVISDDNTLITFKPGDLLYRPEEGALLQLIITGKCDKVCVAVSDGKETYTNEALLPEEGEWNKITLSHNDFKSNNGPLTSWANVIMFKFTAEKEYIINSVLWV